MTDDDRAVYAAARAAYLEGSESIAAIAARLGLSKHKIAAWRRRDDWPARSSRPTKRHPTRPVVGATTSPLTSEQKQAVVTRLWLAIDAALTRLENAMATGDPLTPADSERETRAIGALVRNLGKVAEFEADVRKRSAQGRSGDADAASAADPERLRTALAERLGRVRAGRERGDPVGPDGT